MVPQPPAPVPQRAHPRTTGYHHATYASTYAHDANGEHAMRTAAAAPAAHGADTAFDYSLKYVSPAILMLINYSYDGVAETLFGVYGCITGPGGSFAQGTSSAG